MQPPLRVLFLEDDPNDVDLVRRALHQIDPHCTILHADSETSFVQGLEQLEPDVVLSDHGVVRFNAFDALRLTQARRTGSPFLIVAGAFERTVVECLKAGAADFIDKADLSRLGPAIAAALKLRVPLRKLSHRQRQVLHLLAEGCSTREIAAQLKVSIKTVETHRAQVMKRLDIRDLAGLVRYAVSIGIVSSTP